MTTPEFLTNSATPIEVHFYGSLSAPIASAARTF